MPTQLFSDEFTSGVDQPIGDYNAAWVEVSTGAASSFRVDGAGSSYNSVSDDRVVCRNDVTLENDQYCEVTLETTGWNTGPAVRCDPLTGSGTGYIVAIGPGTSGALWQFRVDAGSLTILAAGVDSSSTGAIAVGSVVRLEAEGTSLRTYHNGLLAHTVTDSNHVGGAPGIEGYSSGGKATSLRAGNLSDPPAGGTNRIRIGNRTPAKLYSGSREIRKLYIGDRLVYEP